MSQRYFTALLGLVCWICALSPAQVPSANRLPIKRVVLYKNGVGYFEHLGQVQGSQVVSISFTSGQLNDVLKSLTVLDLNGGRISGVGYGSRASVDQQLGDLPINPGSGNSLLDFLSRLRGATIEVRSGAGVPVSGRLLGVERKTLPKDGGSVVVDTISLLTSNGELKTTEITPTVTVRLLEKDLAGKVDRFLDVLSQEREPDVRQMAISAEGQGQRNLFVSYISEVPVWKSTYRLVLDSASGKPPLLQGWAIVDNTVGQDWDDVELSLVAGAPQSFIQNLSQPVYTRRPVIEVAGAELSTPQTYQAALRVRKGVVAGLVRDAAGAAIPGATVKASDASGQVVAQTTADQNGQYRLTGLPDGALSITAESPGFRRYEATGLAASSSRTVQRNITLFVGSVSETVEVSDDASNFLRKANMGAGMATSMMAAMESVDTAASGQELGDLFEYKLKERLTIRKNQSALVPIIQSPIQAEKVSIWNEDSPAGRPMRGLWITNSTELTLDGGSFGVLEDNTFAGEGIFDPIRPKEKRLVSYATDLALIVDSDSDSEEQKISRVSIRNGVITHYSETRETTTYTFRNEDTKPRTVILEHGVRDGYKLRSAVEPEETTEEWMRFRVPVGSKETATFVVEEGTPATNTTLITNLDSELLLRFEKSGLVTPQMTAALEGIVAQKGRVAEANNKVRTLQGERNQIFEDQKRVRENMQALKGSAEEKALTQRYTQQLNTQEDRLAELDKELEARRKEAASLQAALNQMIHGLNAESEL